MRYPGFSFQEMVNLVYDNNWQLYQVFSDALLIAIFWEETQFNNIAQEKGTAVGLGQVEPRELWTLKKYGVFTNAKNILNSPAHAVEVTSYYLRHLYESQSSSKRGQVFPFAFLKLDLGTWPGPSVSNMPVRCTM